MSGKLNYSISLDFILEVWTKKLTYYKWTLSLSLSLQLSRSKSPSPSWWRSLLLSLSLSRSFLYACALKRGWSMVYWHKEEAAWQNWTNKNGVHGYSKKSLLNFWLKLNGINLILRKTYSSHGILKGIMCCHGMFYQLFRPVYIILIIHHKNSNYHVYNLQWLFVHYFQCDVNLSRSNDKGVMPLITNSFVDVLVVLLLWNYLEINQQSTKYC